MRLYHVPGTRSGRVLWLLEEIGEAYDLILMSREDRQGEAHLRRHPLGRVPVIEEEGSFVFESAAICLHLADLYPEAGLIPPVGSHERALVYQWTVFAMTELEPAIIQVLEARLDSDDDRAEMWAVRFRAAAAVVERALAGHDYLLEDRFGVADVVCGAVLFFAVRVDVVEHAQNIGAYLERLEARPARQRADAIGSRQD